MIESQEVQQGGVPVVDVHPLVDGLVAIVVGRAVSDAPLHAAAGHPEREALVVVIAAVGPLPVRRATELAPPDDERIVEQAAVGKVGEQAGNGAVDLAGGVLERRAEVEVMIPVSVRHLDEAHAGFHESPRHEALPTEGIGAVAAHAIALERLGRLVADVHHLRHFVLHPEGQLVRFDHALRIGARAAVEPQARRVEPLHEIELGALRGAVEERALDVRHRRRGAAAAAAGEAGEERSSDPRRLVDRRQERTAECPRGGHWRVDDDVAGEILVLRAEAVERPGAERRTDELRGAGVELREGLWMGRQVGGHRVDHAQLVGVSGDLVEEARHPQAALATLAELPPRRDKRCPSPAPVSRRRVLPGVGEEPRLVIEGVDVRRPPLHAEEDHALRPRGEVRGPGGERPGSRHGLGVFRGQRGLGVFRDQRRLGVFRDQRGKGQKSEAVGGVGEERPPRPGDARSIDARHRSLPQWTWRNSAVANNA